MTTQDDLTVKIMEVLHDRLLELEVAMEAGFNVQDRIATTSEVLANLEERQRCTLH
jgi:hypothetical protein